MADKEDLKPILIGIEADSFEGKKILAGLVAEIRVYFPMLAISALLRTHKKEAQRGSEGEKLVLVIKSEAEGDDYEICKQLIVAEKSARDKFPIRSFRIYLLAVGQEIAMSPKLVLPHPELVQNPGVLIAATEIWPDYLHPVLRSSLSEISMAQKVGDIEFVAQGKSLLTENEKMSLLIE